MSGGEFAAIEARAKADGNQWFVDADGDIVHRPNAFDLEDDVNVAYFDNRAHAEMFVQAIGDRAELLAAVRERDNTIARVQAVHYMIRVGNPKPVRLKACAHCETPWPCRTIAALDPQETP